MFIAVICLAFLSPVLSVTKETQKNNYTYFEEKNTDLYFSHLTVNTYTGQVYVGGVNRIYQLSPQLTLEAIAIMGPKEDGTHSKHRITKHRKHKTPNAQNTESQNTESQNTESTKHRKHKTPNQWLPNKS